MMRGNSDAKWDRRIRRANELASSYPFSAEGLRYYARVATFQKDLYRTVEKALADSAQISSDRPLRDELDLFVLLPRFPEFLSTIQQIAPAPLAQSAADMARKGPAAWQCAIEDFWHGEPELASGMDDTEQGLYSERVLAWMFLQPYAEYLADHREIAVVDGTP